MINEFNSTIITVPIAPTSTTDTYPTHDNIYGLDGLRNVDTLADRNAIPNLRRRAGMIVGLTDSTYWRLKNVVWNGTNTDWEPFVLGSLNTFSNGLNQSGYDVKLGGSLTQNTFIDGAYQMIFGNTAPLSNFSAISGDYSGQYTSIYTDGTQSVLRTDNFSTSEYNIILAESGNGISLLSTNSTGSAASQLNIFNNAIGIANNGINNTMVIIDGISSKGFVYSADYSANFTFESLITKRYTDTLVSAYIPLSQKGAPNGVATLDGGGKIPANQLTTTVMQYQGQWNAATNTPTLVNGTGDIGDVYEVVTPGTHNFGAGPIIFKVGDWVVYNGTIWEKSINSNEVVSVNGFTGAITLTTTNIAEGTNLYYTDTRVGTYLSSLSLLYGTIPANQVAYGTGTNNLQSSSNLIFNGSMLGIGTTPVAKLHVYSASGGTNSGILIDVAASGSAYSTIDFMIGGNLSGQFITTGNTFSNNAISSNQSALLNYENNGSIGLFAAGTNGSLRFYAGGYAAANEVLYINNIGQINAVPTYGITTNNGTYGFLAIDSTGKIFNSVYTPTSLIPTLAQVLLVGNKTGETDITSDDTFSSLRVNNGQTYLLYNDGVVVSAASASSSEASLVFQKGANSASIALDEFGTHIADTNLVEINTTNVFINGSTQITSADGNTVVQIFDNYFDSTVTNFGTSISSVGGNGISAYISFEDGINTASINAKNTQIELSHNLLITLTAPDTTVTGNFYATNTFGALYNLASVTGYEYSGAAAGEVNSTDARTRIQHDVQVDISSALLRIDCNTEMIGDLYFFNNTFNPGFEERIIIGDGLKLNSNNGTFEYSLMVNSASSDKIVFGSSDPGFVGALYDQDYSANFVNNSLITKLYADTAIATAVSNGTTIFDITYASLATLKSTNLLVKGRTYRITDRFVFSNGDDRGLIIIKAININVLAKEAIRIMLCPSYYNEAIDGNANDWISVWHETKTVVSGQLAIWGGRVWENQTGVIGTSLDNQNLDGTNWTLINKSTFGNVEYVDIQFNCLYDFDNDWVEQQWDSSGNKVGFDYPLSVDYALGYNPCDLTDWNFTAGRGGGSSYFFNNNVPLGVFNNIGYEVSNNTCGLYEAIKHNSSSSISFNNVFGIIDNVSTSILHNYTGLILSNFNTGSISYNNIGRSQIASNTANVANIIYNTNTGNINSNNNQGHIQFNSNLGTINSNSNNGTISNCNTLLSDINGLLISHTTMAYNQLYNDVVSGNFVYSIDITSLTTLDLTTFSKFTKNVFLKSTNSSETINTIANMPDLISVVIDAKFGLVVNIVHGTGVGQPRLEGGANTYIDGTYNEWIELEKNRNVIRQKNIAAYI